MNKCEEKHMEKFNECKFAAMANFISHNCIDANKQDIPMPFISPVCVNTELNKKVEKDASLVLKKEQIYKYIAIKDPCVCNVCCYFEQK